MMDGGKNMLLTTSYKNVHSRLWTPEISGCRPRIGVCFGRIKTTLKADGVKIRQELIKTTGGIGIVEQYNAHFRRAFEYICKD